MVNPIIQIPIAIGKKDFKLRRWRHLMELAGYPLSQHIRHAIMCYIFDVPCSIGIINRENALKMEDAYKTTSYNISTGDAFLHEWYLKCERDGVKIKRLIKSIIINSIKEGSTEEVEAFCMLVKKYPTDGTSNIIPSKKYDIINNNSKYSAEPVKEYKDRDENDKAYMNFLKSNVHEI